MTMNKRYFFLLALAVMATTAKAQTSLSATERQIAKAVENEMSFAMALLESSVNINSGTFNTAGVRKVGEMYATELAALGFNVEWVSLPDTMKRAGHLVASRRGTKGKKLFLIGHLDTVFEPDMPFEPYSVKGRVATGQGVNDMKGGNVLVIAALKALHRLGLLEDVSITVYFTGDEENAGHPRSISRGDFIKRAQQADIALGFETAAGMNTIATARRGSSEWKLHVKGQQAHSSGIFGAVGYGAIYESARIIDQFRRELAGEKYLTFNPGFIAGGSEISFDAAAQAASVAGKTNIISPEVVVLGDLRFISEEQKLKTREKMKAIVQAGLPGTSASISFKDGIPSMPPTEANAALAKKLSDVSQALGYGPVQPGDPGSRGAGDISYVAEYVDCIDGLGASGRGAHAPGETLNLDDYPKLAKRAAILLYRLTR